MTINLIVAAVILGLLIYACVCFIYSYRRRNDFSNFMEKMQIEITEQDLEDHLNQRMRDAQ